MLPSILNLPSEILAVVVDQDELDDDDVCSLSLVCRKLSVFARRRLLADVTVDTAQRVAKVRAWLQSLSAEERGLVKVIRVEGLWAREGSKEPHVTQEHVASLLNLLPRLDSLKIYKFKTTSFKPPLARALAASGSLRHLTFRKAGTGEIDLTHFFTVLASALNLTSLELVGAKVIFLKKDQNTNPPRPRLRTLEYYIDHNNPKLFEYLSPSLTTLRIYREFSTIEATPILPTLQTLDIGNSPWLTSSMASLPWRSLRRLLVLFIGLERLHSANFELERLDILRCSSDGEGVDNIIGALAYPCCRALKVLDVSGRMPRFSLDDHKDLDRLRAVCEVMRAKLLVTLVQ